MSGSSKTNYPTAEQRNAHRTGGIGDTSAAAVAKLKAEAAAQTVADTKAAIKKLEKQGLAYSKAMTDAYAAMTDARKGASYFTIISANQTGVMLVCTYKPGPGGRIPQSGEPIEILGIDDKHSFVSWGDGSYYVGINTVNPSSKTFTIQLTIPETLQYLNLTGQVFCGLSETKLRNIRNTTQTYKAATAKYLANSKELQALGVKLNKLVIPKATGDGSGSNSNSNGGSVNITPDNGPIEYNVPSVKSAYFRPDLGSTILLSDSGSPVNSAQIKNASDLWNGANSGAHKGMFQTYTYWNMNANDRKSSKGKDPGLPDWYNTSYQKQKYGFQFLYNPSEVNMDWGGIPNVDPGLMMSGKDATPFIVPQASASNISFSLILNRMPDVGILNTHGAQYVSDHLSDFYGNVSPTANGNRDMVDDLTAIQELGTMYDIEYLLSTLVGFKTHSDLRSRWTADMGFLMGLPVELHLGKGLRYLGTINHLSLTHTIFGKGMVPLFTNVQIGFARRIEPSKANTEASVTANSHGGYLTPNLSTPASVAASSLNRIRNYKSKNGGSF